MVAACPAWPPILVVPHGNSSHPPVQMDSFLVGRSVTVWTNVLPNVVKHWRYLMRRLFTKQRTLTYEIK
jgi:hypothetical protein